MKANIQGEVQGKKSSGTGQKHSQEHGPEQSTQHTQGIPVPPYGPTGRGKQHTWNKNGHCFLLAQDWVKKEAGHIFRRAMFHHQRNLHTEQPFSILDMSLRNVKNFSPLRALHCTWGFGNHPDALHLDPILLWPCDKHWSGRAHTFKRVQGGLLEPRDARKAFLCTPQMAALHSGVCTGE